MFFETRKFLKTFVFFKIFEISTSLLKKILFDDRNKYILSFTISLTIKIFLFLICISFFANETSNSLRLKIEIDRKFAFNFDTCKTFFICTFWPFKSTTISSIHLTCSISSLIMMTMVRVSLLKTNNDSFEIMCLLTLESMIHVLSEGVFLTAKAKFMNFRESDVIQTFSEFFSFSFFFWAARADFFFLCCFFFWLMGFRWLSVFDFFFSVYFLPSSVSSHLKHFIFMWSILSQKKHFRSFFFRDDFVLFAVFSVLWSFFMRCFTSFSRFFVWARINFFIFSRWYFAKV